MMVYVLCLSMDGYADVESVHRTHDGALEAMNQCVLRMAEQARQWAEETDRLHTRYKIEVPWPKLTPDEVYALARKRAQTEFFIQEREVLE